MSRVAVKNIIFAIALGVSVFLAGCEEFAKEEDFYAIKLRRSRHGRYRY